MRGLSPPAALAFPGRPIYRCVQRLHCSLPPSMTQSFSCWNLWWVCRGGNLLKILLWGLRDPLWLCVDSSCTDVGGLGDKSNLLSHQACQYFLSTCSVQGRKCSSAFRRSVSKSESIICQIFPMSGTRIDPMESF